MEPVMKKRLLPLVRHIHITDCRISDIQGTLGYYSCGILVTTLDQRDLNYENWQG
jgi:hypothetical protein